LQNSNSKPRKAGYHIATSEMDLASGAGGREAVEVWLSVPQKGREDPRSVIYRRGDLVPPER